MGAYKLLNTYTGELLADENEHPFRNLALYHNGRRIWLGNEPTGRRRAKKQPHPIFDVVLACGAIVVAGGLVVSITHGF